VRFVGLVVAAEAFKGELVEHEWNALGCEVGWRVHYLKVKVGRRRLSCISEQCKHIALFYAIAAPNAKAPVFQVRIHDVARVAHTENDLIAGEIRNRE
jgi:hypothetical protein